MEYSKVYQPYTKHSVSIPEYTVSRLSVPFVKYSKVYQPYTKHSVSIPEYTVSRLSVFFRSIRESTFWHRGKLFRILGRLGRLTVYSKILSRALPVQSIEAGSLKKFLEFVDSPGPKRLI